MIKILVPVNQIIEGRQEELNLGLHLRQGDYWRRPRAIAHDQGLRLRQADCWRRPRARAHDQGLRLRQTRSLEKAEKERQLKLGLRLRQPDHRRGGRKKVQAAVPTMALPAMPSLFSPAANITILVVSFICIWLLSYVMDWLRMLDSSSSGSREQNPSLEDPATLETSQFPSLYTAAEKYISLIIPAYNEEARLPGTLDETLRYLQERAKQEKAFTYEIIIVDDGSTDRTVQVAFEYVKRLKVEVVRVIKQGTNQGKGAAVRKGMLFSRGQLLLFLDADGATQITELGKLEIEIKAAAESSSSKLGELPIAVFGSRAYLEKHALATRKWYRNILMHGFHILVLLVAGPRVKDTQCGFKMFTRSAARQLFLNMRLKRFAFDVELVYLAARLGIPILEIAVTWTEIPGSKVRIRSMIYMAFELMLVRLGYGFHFWKIHQRPALD